MDSNEAPREVWLHDSMNVIAWEPSDPVVLAASTKYVRADLVPSVPLGERERRLAEALTKLWQMANCQNPASECSACAAINRGEWLDKALCEARAILSSPAAPSDPKADRTERVPAAIVEKVIAALGIKADR